MLAAGGQSHARPIATWLVSNAARSPRRPPLCGDELVALTADALDQLFERGGEFLHALTLQHRDDVVVVDAGLRQLLERALGVIHAPLECRLNAAVVLEVLDRLTRHRVDGLGADQLLHVYDVALLRILSRRRGTQATMRRHTGRLELLPVTAVE